MVGAIQATFTTIGLGMVARGQNIFLYMQIIHVQYMFSFCGEYILKSVLILKLVVGHYLRGMFTKIFLSRFVNWLFVFVLVFFIKAQL